jgi:hypothetical protein
VAGHQRDLVGDHEARVEADTELTDQLLGLLGLLELGEELGGAGLGDGADEAHHLVPRHADPVVPHGERARDGVGLQLDVEVSRLHVQLLVAERLQSELVERVRRVRDQLTQEGVLVRVHRVNHQLQ